MRALQSVSFTNISATTATFNLYGGVYCMDVVGTFGGAGAVTLSRLGPDSSTYITAATAITANGTSGAISLPPGTYKVIVADTTALSVSLVRIPGE